MQSKRMPANEDINKTASLVHHDPRTSQFLPVWDVIAHWLWFTASVTPYEVSFLPTPSPLSSA